jgi:hypothetical protein
MPLDVTAQTEIDRDSKAVAAYAFEPTNDPIWIGGIWLNPVKMLDLGLAQAPRTVLVSCSPLRPAPGVQADASKSMAATSGSIH